MVVGFKKGKIRVGNLTNVIVLISQLKVHSLSLVEVVFYSPVPPQLAGGIVEAYDVFLVPVGPHC